MKGDYSDQQIINGIKTRDNLVLRYLLDEYLEKVIKYVTRNNGTKQKAEDVFQDVIEILFYQLNKEDFKLKATFEAYFTAIYQNVWKSEVKQNNKINVTNTFPETLEYEETDIQNEIKREQLRKLANEEYIKLDKESRTLLDLFYYKKKTMAEIAYRMDFKDGNTAKTLKCRAVAKLKDIIKATTIFKKLQNE